MVLKLYFAFLINSKQKICILLDSKCFREIFAFLFQKNLAFFHETDWSKILEKSNMFAFFVSKRNAKKNEKFCKQFNSLNKCLIKWIKRLILEIRLYRDLLKARICDIFHSRLYCELCTTGDSKNRFRDN